MVCLALLPSAASRAPPWRSFRAQQPARCLVVMSGIVAAEAPGNGLRDGPAANAVAIKAELARHPIQAINDLLLRVPELAAADDRRQRKFALPHERFRVDHQPGLALRG